MENTEKLTNSKAVIAYIAEQFPNCFSVEGEAKPLKIGIFEDLAARLDGDTRVSKTQLRAALRQYTSSWRYLHGVKPGAVRVDLDGNACGELEEEHIEHARKALEESKAKAAERRKEKAKEQRAKDAQARKQGGEGKKPAKSGKPQSDRPRNNERQNAPRRKPAHTVKNEQAKKTVTVRAVTSEDLVIGKQVNVSMGKGLTPAQIVEVNKNEVRVRLTNGLTMVVKAEHLSL